MNPNASCTLSDTIVPNSFVALQWYVPLSSICKQQFNIYWTYWNYILAANQTVFKISLQAIILATSHQQYNSFLNFQFLVISNLIWHSDTAAKIS